MVVVEQPDTIVSDVYTPKGVALVEFRTSAFGDASDKYVRLAVRGTTLAVPPHSKRRPGAEQPRSQRPQ